MKTCPECGNRYRDEVARCPNDNAALGSVGRPPTGGAGPPKEPRSTRPEPTTWDDEPATLREGSSATSWIVVVLLSLGMVGAYAYLEPRLSGEIDQEATVSEEDDEPRTVRKKRRRARGATTERGQRELTDEEIIAQDLASADDVVLGDVFAREPDRADHVAPTREPEEEYVPPPDVYQPNGRYVPTARYSDGSAAGGAVEIDLSNSAGGGPLPEEQVKAVLNERRLMPCYDRWVDRVPQMKGRVNMKFVVAPSGQVSRVRITDSQLRSKVVEKCIVDRARGFRFPASPGGQSTKFDTHFDFTNR